MGPSRPYRMGMSSSLDVPFETEVGPVSVASRADRPGARRGDAWDVANGE